MAKVKKTISQLRERVRKVLKSGRPKQLKKLKKAYGGRYLNNLWASRASFEGLTIAECKDLEGVGNRMKGGHRYNHIYNKCHKHVFRSKQARKNVDHEDKKEFVRVFYLGLRLNHNFGEFLHKIFHKNNRSTAQQGKG